MTYNTVLSLIICLCSLCSVPSLTSPLNENLILFLLLSVKKRKSVKTLFSSRMTATCNITVFIQGHLLHLN